MNGSLREMRMFVAAYEELSFTSAAKREHATQSGVSQTIRNIEERLKIQLFIREKGKVTPSPAGHDFYAHCSRVLRSHEAALQSMAQYAKGQTGEIVVGLMPTMTRTTLTPALTRFMALHPNASVRIVDGYSAALTQLVRAEEIDFAIVPAFAGLAGLRSRLFLRVAEVLVCGGDDQANLTPMRLPDISPLRLVLPSAANTRRTTIETYLTTNGVRVDRILELDTMFGTLDFVARTDWATILPAIMFDRREPPQGMTLHPLRAPGLSLDLVLIESSRKPLSAPAEAFCELLRHTADELNRQWLDGVPD